MSLRNAGINTLQKQNTLADSPTNTQCILYSLTTQPSLLLLLCQYAVHPYRALDWTSCLFKHVTAERLACSLFCDDSLFSELWCLILFYTGNSPPSKEWTRHSCFKLLPVLNGLRHMMNPSVHFWNLPTCLMGSQRPC